LAVQDLGVVGDATIARPFNDVVEEYGIIKNSEHLREGAVC
jgi:hypothetical protein